MLMGFHPTELIVIFVIALLVFGPKKLPEMGAQIGKGINAFKKGMREIREPVENSIDLESLTAEQNQLRSLEDRLLELEILERELAVKQAEAALRATQGILATTVEKGYIEEDNVVSSTIVDAGSIAPAETDHATMESVESAEPVSSKV